MSVVEFPAKPDPAPEEALCLMCNCGSTTFRILSTGAFECASCEDVLTDDLSGVDYSRVKRVGDNVELRSRTDHGTIDFAFNQVISKADKNSTAGVVVMQLSGQTLVWSVGAKSEDEREWFKTRIADLEHMLCD